VVLRQVVDALIKFPLLVVCDELMIPEHLEDLLQVHHELSPCANCRLYYKPRPLASLLTKTIAIFCVGDLIFLNVVVPIGTFAVAVLAWTLRHICHLKTARAAIALCAFELLPFTTQAQPFEKAFVSVWVVAAARLCLCLSCLFSFLVVS
jgi:hypothetical protein